VWPVAVNVDGWALTLACGEASQIILLRLRAALSRRTTVPITRAMSQLLGIYFPRTDLDKILL